MELGSASGLPLLLHFLIWVLVTCLFSKFLNMFICDLNTFSMLCYILIRLKNFYKQRLKKYENNTILKPQLQFWSSGNRKIPLFSFISFFFSCKIFFNTAGYMCLYTFISKAILMSIASDIKC